MKTMFKILLKRVVFYVKSFVFFPLYIIFKTHPSRNIMLYELLRYRDLVYHENWGALRSFFEVITHNQDYRKVFYLRCGFAGVLLNFVYPSRKDFYFFMPSSRVGQGLVVHHAISTRVSCKRIGSDCQIWQLVTIGKGRHTKGLDSTPTIGNNVKISVGAIVVGDIEIGNNVTIGAGAVVTKSVPNNCTVVGNPAFIIARDGVRIREKL